MEFNRKIEPSLKLNTKGCCFLCLQSEIIKSEEPKACLVLQSVSLRQLFCHLQILTDHTLNERSLVGYNCKKEDIQVDLCESCGHIIRRFSVLFQELEKIKLEMDYFLEGIHKCISQSAKSAELVQNYSKRMTSDLEALSQLAFVDNLRKQVAKECLRKLKVLSLRVNLTRTNNKLIKTKGNNKTGEINEDFPENCFVGNTLPPPSPCSTADLEEDIKISNFSSPSPSNEKVYPSFKSSIKSKTLRRKRSKYYSRHPSTGMYTCQRCDKSSKCLYTIIKHFKTVHLKLRHKCDICNVSIFSQLSHLNFHKKTCREKLEKKLANEKDQKFKFICKLCGKRFDANSKLAKHTKYVHENANRFKCDLGDKKYKSNFMLKSHRAAIHQSRKLFCKGCNKMYKDVWKFKKHEKKCVDKVLVKLESVGFE